MISHHSLSHFFTIKNPELRFWRIAAAFCFVAGIAMRVWLRQSTSLWEDEVIAATHAAQPVGRLIINCIINDMHPPLYFLELHFWALLSQSDFWLIANSVCFSFAAMFSLFIVVKRLQGETYALAVSSIYAISSVPVWMAEEVRMYAFLSVLFIWMYYYTTTYFLNLKRNRYDLLKLFLIGIAIVYAHAIGFIAILFFGFYAAYALIQQKNSRSIWIDWLILNGTIAICAMPLLASDLLRSADMPALKSALEMYYWASSVIVGEGFRHVAWLNVISFCLYCLVCSDGLLQSKTRSLTLWMLIFPLLFCLLIDVIGRPLFKVDFFSNFISLFFAIALGSLLVNGERFSKVRTALSMLSIGVLLALTLINRVEVNRAENYYANVFAVIRDEAHPSDIVWAPQTDIFWAAARYLVAPDWGSPVTTVGPLRDGSGWYKLYKFLGPALVQSLDILPKQQAITSPSGLTLMTSSTSQSIVEESSRVWLIVYGPRDDLPANLPGKSLGDLSLVRSYSFPPIEMELYQK